MVSLTHQLLVAALSISVSAYSYGGYPQGGSGSGDDNAENLYTATSTAAVAAAAATAKTDHSTSNVRGKAFDRLAIIWLENTDYDKAVSDRESQDAPPS